MSVSADAFALAMQLPPKDRAELAHRLLLSLEPEDHDDDDAPTVWAEEIDARLQKIAAGNYEAHDWREAIEKVRGELRKESPS